MTYEEARKIIMSDFEIGTQKTADALVTAVECIEKQIPKKPNYVQYDADEKIGNYHCPHCNIILFLEPDDGRTIYCVECGQALDWSGEE